MLTVDGLGEMKNTDVNKIWGNGWLKIIKKHLGCFVPKHLLKKKSKRRKGGREEGTEGGKEVRKRRKEGRREGERNQFTEGIVQGKYD